MLPGIRQGGDGYCASRDAGAACVGVVGHDGQCAVATLDKGGVADNRTCTVEDVRIGVVLHNDAVGFDIAIETYGKLRGIVVEDDFVTSHKTVALTCGIGEIAGSTILPDIVLYSTPIDVGVVAHTGDVKIYLAVFQRQTTTHAGADTLYLNVVDIAVDDAGLAYQITACCGLLAIMEYSSVSPSLIAKQ